MKSAQQTSSKKTILVISAVGIFALIAFIFKPNLTFAQTENFFVEPEITTFDQETSVLYQENPFSEQEIPTQNNISLTAIPPRLGEDNSLKALPGEKLQVQVRIRNISEETVKVVTSSKDFITAEDGETPIAVDDTTSNRWSLASWLTITPTENIIGSNETVGLNVLIEIPEDALPGGHYAMILHQPNNGSGNFQLDSGSQSSINQRVGTLLYVIVDGAINEEAYIRNFKFPKFTEYGPVPFSYTIENGSDIHIAPQMNVEIFNLLNQKVDDIQINSKNVFPLTNRDFNGEWKRIWGFGFYKARLTTSFGTSGAVVIANTSFWLLPIKLVIALIVSLLTIIILFISIKRHLNHRRDQDKNKIAELEGQIQEMNSEGGDQNDSPQL